MSVRRALLLLLLGCAAAVASAASGPTIASEQPQRDGDERSQGAGGRARDCQVLPGCLDSDAIGRGGGSFALPVPPGPRGGQGAPRPSCFACRPSEHSARMGRTGLPSMDLAWRTEVWRSSAAPGAPPRRFCRRPTREKAQGAAARARWSGPRVACRGERGADGRPAPARRGPGVVPGPEQPAATQRRLARSLCRPRRRPHPGAGLVHRGDHVQRARHAAAHLRGR